METSVEAQLRAALQAIADYEPERDYTPLDNADCADCAEWRDKNHPIQSMCYEHVRQFYRQSDANRDAINRMGWHLKTMACDALWAADHPGVDGGGEDPERREAFDRYLESSEALGDSG